MLAWVGYHRCGCFLIQSAVLPNGPIYREGAAVDFDARQQDMLITDTYNSFTMKWLFESDLAQADNEQLVSGAQPLRSYLLCTSSQENIWGGAYRYR